MSTVPESGLAGRRLLIVRVLQVSPLVVLALMAAVWFSIPARERSATLLTNAAQLAAPEGSPQRDPVEAALRRTLEERDAIVLPNGMRSYQEVPAATGSEALVESMPEVLDAVNGDKAVVVDRSGITVRTIKPDDSSLKRIAAYEKRTGASVIALVADRVRPVRVVYASIVNPMLLSPEQLAEIEESRTAEALRRSIVGSAAADYETLGSSMGGLLGPRVAEQHGTLVIGGRLYEVYLVHPDAKSESASMPDLTGITSVKEERVKRALDRIAKATGGVALIAGPVDAPPRLLRAPSSLTEGEALRIGARVVEEHLMPYGAFDGSAKPLPDSLRDAAPRDARWSAMAVRSGSVNPAEAWSTPAVFLIALTAGHPAIPALDAALARQPWRRIQARLAAYLPIIAGALAALFVAGLIASPSAFAYERRLNAERELRRERELLRERARRGVLERLEELSLRIDRVAAASERTRDEIALVSRDIDATVSELRILFDTRYEARDPHE